MQAYYRINGHTQPEDDKLERKEKKMKKIVENMRRGMKRIGRYYVEVMTIYGEALMKGGSYGCV